MGTIQLVDGFGLTGSITPGQGVLKYFKNLPQSITAKTNLSQIATRDLTDPAVTSLQAGLAFSEPVNIGNPAVNLKVGVSASGAVSIFVPAKDKSALFEPDLFGDNIHVDANQRYVSLALIAQLTTSIAATEGKLKFGFDGKTGVTLSYFQLFTPGTQVKAAVESTFGNFCVPGDLDDVAAMPENSIATVESTGDLKFSGTVNLLVVANPLASVELPVGGAIKIAAGPAVKVGASYEFKGEYQMRVQKLAGNAFRLGFYRKKDSIFDFSVTADASLTAKLGDNDLFVQVIKAVSSDPTADLKALEAEGVADDQAKAIQSALKSAVNRSLEIGASVELSASLESDAMFLYEVDLDTVSAEARTLVNSAMEGDLSLLVAADDALPAGIKILKTLISRSKSFEHSLKLNLLGIYNVLSMSKLVNSGSVAWDATTGELILTDKISEDRIDILTSNLQVKNPDKLRQLLSEHFLITATYRSVSNIVDSADVEGIQAYFHMEQNPTKVRMRDYLNLSVSLGLQDAAAVEQVLINVGDYGKTTVYAEARYSDAAFRSLFFADGVLLDPEIYAAAGREAIKSLVAPGDDDDYRLKLANNPALLQALQKIGSVTSTDFINTCVQAGIPHDLVPFVGVDYLNIVWFQKALQSAGQKLSILDQFLKSNPDVDLRIDPNFINLKKQLANSLSSVVKQATADFGGPWGFEAMACLKKFSSKKWLITNQYITKELSSS